MSLLSWIKLKFSTPSVARIPSEGISRTGFTFVNTELATNETVYAAISFRSNAIATAPITLRHNYAKVNPNDAGVLKTVAHLLDYGPNEYQSTFQFIKLIETLRCTKPNAYVIKEYDDMKNVIAMYVLDSDAVTPFLTEDKELWYFIRSKDGDTYISSEHIMNFYFNSADGINGICPMDVLKDTVEFEKELKSLYIAQLQENLKFKVAITVNSSLNDEKLAKYKETIKSFKNSGVLILDNGKDAKALDTAIGSYDTSLINFEKITVERVSRVFQIPASKLNTNVLNNNSIDSEDLVYIKDSILPSIRAYEQIFTQSLVPQHLREDGYYIKMSMNGFARANMEIRGEFYQKMLRNGVMTINEVRELEDIPPIGAKDADVLHVSRDLIPIDMLRKLVEIDLNNSKTQAKGKSKDTLEKEEESNVDEYQNS